MVEQFLNIMTEIISSNDTKEATLKNLHTLTINEPTLKQFLLFTFTLVEGLSRKHSTVGFKDNESEYFHKILDVEKILKECCEELGKEKIYNEIITKFSTKSANN